ncbi:MAG: response regulator transcription factor [Anaerolineales bacterium]|nr:response regulator transcription factor [Anaerolineales bacterium]
MEKIRVLLVDDHDVLRAGLRSLLEHEEDIQVVGEAGDGEEAIRRAQEALPDVVLMDLTMPKMGGLEATRHILALKLPCRILVLTVHEDKQYFFEMLNAGALGYVTKRTAADELIAAIRAVATGNVYLQPVLARWLLDDYRRLSDNQQTVEKVKDETDPQFLLHQLSEREIQVIELVAEGLTSPQISERLGISPKTVARHRERIMDKLNLSSSAALVKFALQVGLI